jgi:hypothetical protein
MATLHQVNVETSADHLQHQEWAQARVQDLDQLVLVQIVQAQLQELQVIHHLLLVLANLNG